LALFVATPALAQSVQELIDLDRQLAVQKRKAELAEAKRRTDSVDPRPSRPLVSPEPRRPEDDFQVRGVFGPLDNLTALVSYKGDVPVVLGRSAPTQTVGGWSVASMSPQQIVLERPAASRQAAKDKHGALIENMERIVLPVRLNPLPTAADLKSPTALPGQGTQVPVFGAPISPVLSTR
jgi:hypothetical protein